MADTYAILLETDEYTDFIGVTDNPGKVSKLLTWYFEEHRDEALEWESGCLVRVVPVENNMLYIEEEPESVLDIVLKHQIVPVELQQQNDSDEVNLADIPF